MRIYAYDIHCRNSSVCTHNICTFQSIIGKKSYTPRMRICTDNIHGCYRSVTINVSFQVDLHILRHICRANRYGVLSCDMVFLHHLHGVGAGGNICDGVACSVTLDNSLIRSFGRTAFGELNSRLYPSFPKHQLYIALYFIF